MAQKFTFEDKTINGEEYVIAQPRGREAEPVRVRAGWIDRDDLEGEWEELITQILRRDTLADIDIGVGHGGIDRRQAVDALAGAERDGETLVSSEDQADVLVEYLASEDIVDIKDGQVVLFRDPSEQDGELPGHELMNWAALMSAVIEMVDDRLDRFGTAKEQFEETLDTLEEQRSGVDSSDRLSEVGQRLQNLGPGEGIPEPADLGEDERGEYRRLKRQFVFHKKMEDAREQNVFENVNVGTQEMADAIKRLEDARRTYKEFRADIREAAFRTNAFPEEAMEFVKNAGDLIADMSGVGRVDETVENMDESEFAEMVENEVGGLAQEEAERANRVAETAEKAAGFER